MLHRRAVPRGPGPKTTSGHISRQTVSGQKTESERGVKGRRGTPASDTPTQFETELMNEQAKGPSDDSTVWQRRMSGPTLDTDTCCRQGM